MTSSPTVMELEENVLLLSACKVEIRSWGKNDPEPWLGWIKVDGEVKVAGKALSEAELTTILTTAASKS